MGIRKEIKLVIKEYATCTVGANEAINAISNIVSRPKPEKLFPKLIDPTGPCQARQHSDLMLCKHCGIGWDMNDPDPPKCRRESVPLEDVLLPEITKEMFKKI